MSNLGDVIKVIGNTEGVKWYSMLECTAQIENTTRIVHLPACFLKQIGIKFDGDYGIKDEDFMLSSIEGYKLERCLPYDDKNIESGLRKVGDYWAGVLPKKYTYDFQKIYLITRIALCACALSCRKNEEIDGIGKVCDNTPELWNEYRNNFALMEDAILSKGRIIGPLQGNFYFTGWKILSMIYSMLWCNSDIRENKDEILAVIEVLTDIDTYFQKLVPGKSDFINIIILIEKKVCSHNLSGMAWVILYLYIRNYIWYAEYMSEVLSVVDVQEIAGIDFGKLHNITANWKIRNDKDLIKNIVALSKKSPKEYKWLIKALLGPEERKNESTEIAAKRKQLRKRSGPLELPLRFAFFRYFCDILSRVNIDDSEKENFYKQIMEQTNIGFLICIEMMLYNRFFKIEFPNLNNLDFVKEAGQFDSVSRGTSTDQYSVTKLYKGMEKAFKKPKIGDWEEFSSYERIYRILTAPIKSAIVHNRDIILTYREYHVFWRGLQNNLIMLLQYMSEINME